MKKMAIVSGAFLALTGLILVACGVGGGTSDDTALTTCKPDEPPVFTTPVNLPADQKQFQSPDRGYTANYPATWEARANQASIGNATVDAFLGPSAGPSIRVNISVTCETIPVGATSRQFTDDKINVMQRVFGGSPSRGEQTLVDGKEAYLITYVIEEDTPVPAATPGPTKQPLEAETVQVMFADERGGWTISLLTPKGQLSTYRPLFDAFVASFHEE